MTIVMASATGIVHHTPGKPKIFGKTTKAMTTKINERAKEINAETLPLPIAV